MWLEEETVRGAKMPDPEASRHRNLPLHGMQGPQWPPPQLEGSGLSRPSSGTDCPVTIYREKPPISEDRQFPEGGEGLPLRSR